MGASFRKPKINVLPYRLTIWSVLLVVVLVGAIQSRPITLEDSPARAQGIEITRDGDADILIVLDYEAIGASGDVFGERDFSAAWITLMQREVGPVAVATPQTLTEQRLEASRVVILTASVSDALPEAMLNRAREHALDGALLVLERPAAQARAVFSADGVAGARRGRRITHAAGLDDPYADQLESMPLFVDYQGSTAPREGAETLLAIDGAPVIYALEFGDGHVVTIDFDLTRQLVALQQGRPAEDFSVPRQADKTSRSVRTADLVAHDDLRGAATPYADLLGRFVIYGVLMRYAALPGFWIFPQAADGAMVLIHDDASLGDGGAWTLDYERQQGASSTLYSTMDAGLSPAGAQNITDKGGELGFAWYYDDLAPELYEPVGIWGFYPFRRPPGLATQLAQLRDGADLGRLRTSRIIDGRWSTQWSQPMEALAEAGMQTDSSYEVPTHRGYSFGTGLPFLMLNDQGIPLSIRQYPVVVPDDATEGPELGALLAASAGGHHQLVTLATRPSRYAEYPDITRFERWLETFDLAREHNHIMLNIGRFEAYQRMRRAGSIRSRLDRHTTLPEDLRDDQTGPDHRATLVRVTAEVHQRNMHLTVPAYIGDAAFFGALRGQERVGNDIVTSEVETDEATMIGFAVRRVRLEQGFNQFEFYYRQD